MSRYGYVQSRRSGPGSGTYRARRDSACRKPAVGRLGQNVARMVRASGPGKTEPAFSLPAMRGDTVAPGTYSRLCISAGTVSRRRLHKRQRALARGIWVLRIACADAWPGLLEECRQAVKAIRPDNKVGTVQSDGLSRVSTPRVSPEDYSIPTAAVSVTAYGGRSLMAITGTNIRDTCSPTNHWKSSISVAKRSTILRSAGGSPAGTQSPSPAARR
jgi:hypothetical protein